MQIMVLLMVPQALLAVIFYWVAAHRQQLQLLDLLLGPPQVFSKTTLVLVLLFSAKAL